MGADEVGSGEQPGGEAGTPSRLVVVLGRSADSGRICRVDEPGRVLRIWSLLNDAERTVVRQPGSRLSAHRAPSVLADYG